MYSQQLPALFAPTTGNTFFSRTEPRTEHGNREGKDFVVNTARFNDHEVNEWIIAFREAHPRNLTASACEDTIV